MKISTIIPVTNAIRRGDTFIEAIKSHLYFSDELIVVDGESTDGTVQAIEALGDRRIKIITLKWPEDWDWVEYSLHANKGFEAATGDWVVDGESDHIWHERDVDKIHRILESHLTSDFPLLEVERAQITTVDRLFIKAKLPCFINKRHFEGKIGYGIDRNGLSDLGKPLLIKSKIKDYLYEGTLITPVAVGPENRPLPEIGVPIHRYKNTRTPRRGDEGRRLQIEAQRRQLDAENRRPLMVYNYLYPFKSWKQIVTERVKAFRAWNKCEYLKSWNRHLPEEYNEVEEFCRRQMLAKHERTGELAFENHPEIMRQRFKDLRPGMFGYDLCGLISHQPYKSNLAIP